jgi:nitrate reductase delta subunit
MSATAIKTSSADLRHGFVLLAELLKYPTADRISRWTSIQSALDSACPEAGREVSRFLQLAGAETDMEAAYLRTFEITPTCAPYISIHLFGEENFKRGEFMVALRGRYQESGLDTEGELPDHITVVLGFAGSIDGDELRELAELCLMGPLVSMLAALDDANPYHSLLRAVLAVVRTLYPDLKLPSVEEARPRKAMSPPGLHCGAGCGPTFVPLGAVSEAIT